MCWTSAESRVPKPEECISPSMATHTSSWCWWQTWAELEMCILSRARAPRLPGTQCKGTGVKYGSTVEMPCMDRIYPSWSPQATEGHWSPKTLLPQAGSLAKLLKELSSNKNNKKSSSPAAATAKRSCSFWLVTIICLDHIPAWAPTTCNTERALGNADIENDAHPGFMWDEVEGARYVIAPMSFLSIRDQVAS